MKSSNVKSQERKKTIWDYLSRNFGKSFWIMTILCVSCTANMAVSSTLPLTDNGSEAKNAFSPDEIDFGVLPLAPPALLKQ